MQLSAKLGAKLEYSGAQTTYTDTWCMTEAAPFQQIHKITVEMKQKKKKKSW